VSKHDPTLPVKGRFYNIEGAATLKRKLPFSEDDGFEIRHDPYNLSRSRSPYFSKNSPQFFETFSKALHGLERKMNYLNSIVKTPV
jgi:hypothetical protein